LRRLAWGTSRARKKGNLAWGDASNKMCHLKKAASPKTVDERNRRGGDGASKIRSENELRGELKKIIGGPQKKCS